MSSSPMISIRSLSVALGDRCIFDNVNFNIFRGDCILLSGQNGAGKTTLLRIIAGLIRPDSAKCSIAGFPRIGNWKSARPWLLKNIVYLHQDPFLFDGSVRENIMYGLRRRGLSKKTAFSIVEDALNWGELRHLADRNGMRLSGGEKQRVALLRASVLNPALLLLDEPIANMDDNGRHNTLFLIRRLISNGASIMITAHEPRLFLPMSDRHLRLHHGQLHTVTKTPAASGYPTQTTSNFPPKTRTSLHDQHI
ncbi:MAG: ABC transporter ATP-binding protein [Gammaproteobacteria bacterium]